MLEFTDSQTKARDHGLITDAIFSDFAKAFDKVPHIHLLAKLNSCGIQGEVFRWIESFLSNRSFRVRIDTDLSLVAPVTSQLPQGSVQGPLLFLIFVNDLPEILTSNCLIYADDLEIWNSYDPSLAQLDTDAIKRWSQNWHLPLSETKCVNVSFGGDSENLFVSSHEQGAQSIPNETRIKDLGVWLEASLSFFTTTKSPLIKHSGYLG